MLGSLLAVGSLRADVIPVALLPADFSANVQGRCFYSSCTSLLPNMGVLSPFSESQDSEFLGTGAFDFSDTSVSTAFAATAGVVTASVSIQGSPVGGSAIGVTAQTTYQVMVLPTVLANLSILFGNAIPIITDFNGNTLCAGNGLIDTEFSRASVTVLNINSAATCPPTGSTGSSFNTALPDLSFLVGVPVKRYALCIC
jgi:hypothetical protein